MPVPNNQKKSEIRESWLTTQLLLFLPGLTPSTLPLDLEAAMAEFVETEDCPSMLKKEYLSSMEKSREPEQEEEEVEVEPLLPTPPPRCPRDVQQDPYMAGLGAQLTVVDLNNMNCINTDEEMAGQDNTAADYAHLVTDEEEDWCRDRVLLGLTDTDIAEAEKWLERAMANTPMVE